jgi:hypothetical protein
VNAQTFRILAASSAILLASVLRPTDALAQRVAAARVAPRSAAVVATPAARRAAVVAAPGGTAVVAQPRGAVVVGGGYHYHSGGYHYAYPAYGSFYVGYPWYAGGVSFSVGVGFGYPAYGYPYYAYPYATPYPYGYYGYPAGPVYYDGSAAMRLQVTPRNTEVYIDGFYAGVVDNFDGTFQRLNIDPGQHEVELYLPGHRTLSRNVYLQPGKTTSMKYAMEPLAPGEPEPLKPSPRQDPSITPSTPATPSPQRPSGAGQSGTARRQTPAPPRDYPRETANDGGLTVYKGEPNIPLDSNASGSLSLRVQPGPATIKIDGEQWDASPDSDRVVVQLSPGSHVLEVQKDGYHRYTTEVIVKSGQTSTLNVALTKN